MTSPGKAPAMAPGSVWREILARPALDEFAAAFSPTVELEATVFNGRAVGPEALRLFFGATRGMYDSIAFTDQLDDDSQALLMWRGRAFGGRAVRGITVLSYDHLGLIAEVTLFHAPLGLALACAAYLRDQLGDRLGPDVRWLAAADL